MSTDDFDAMAEFRRAMATSKYDSEKSPAFLKAVERSVVSTSLSDLDDRINFRINSELKAEFETICKLEHSTVTAEIKRFIVQVVRRQSLN